VPHPEGPEPRALLASSKGGRSPSLKRTPAPNPSPRRPRTVMTPRASPVGCCTEQLRGSPFPDRTPWERQAGLLRQQLQRETSAQQARQGSCGGPAAPTPLSRSLPIPTLVRTQGKVCLKEKTKQMKNREPSKPNPRDWQRGAGRSTPLALGDVVGTRGHQPRLRDVPLPRWPVHVPHDALHHPLDALAHPFAVETAGVRGGQLGRPAPGARAPLTP